MKFPIFCSLFCAFLFSANESSAVTAIVEPVATFPSQQLTGVAVSRRGRIFVNFPDWSDSHAISVAEIVDGKPRPYPNAEWNQTEGAPDKRFICVQSVFIDESDSLWILDPAAPKMKETVKGGPKLVKVDLIKNKVLRTIRFSEAVAPRKSYLNDVRIELKAHTAYITHSGLGAIVVADLSSGKARRVLEDDRSRSDRSPLDLADSLAWGPDGSLYVTASQIQNMARFNGGRCPIGSIPAL